MKTKILFPIIFTSLFTLASCNHFDPIPAPTEGVLSSITVSDQTTSYFVNDTFEFDGVVTAHYSNNTTKVVTPTDVSSPNMSTAGDKTVNVYYTEGDITKSTSYTIVVSEKGEPSTDSFATLVNKILTGHNYTMNIDSYLVNHRAEDEYIDTFVAINNKAFYWNWYSGHQGYIYQKNQGYVAFYQLADGGIIPDYFISTNPNVGLSDIEDLVGENLFISDYIKDSEGVYHCASNDVIAVASNFTGYMDSWFVAGSEVTVVPHEHSLTLTYGFQVAYIEEGEGTLEDGIMTIEITNIGTSTNAMVEAYIENPTTTFVAKTEWDEYDIDDFNNYLAGYIPPFIPNASYALTIDTKDVYDGVELYITDYGCGNQLQSYINLLKRDGFTQNGSATKYQKIVEDIETQQTTTFDVELAYISPSESYYGRTVGYFYPAGIFQMMMKSRTRSSVKGTITVDQFNSYIISNNLEQYVPVLTFGDKCTKITQFEDRTAQMNQLFDNKYLFYTSYPPQDDGTGGSSFMRFYFATYSDMKQAMTSYLADIATIGYDSPSVPSGSFISYCNTTWNDNMESYIQMTYIDSITEANYKGFIEIRYCVYIPDHPKGDDSGYPTITYQADSHVTSVRFTDANGNAVTKYDRNKDGGYFFMKATTEEGYKIKSVSLVEDDTAIIDYNEAYSRYEIKPNKDIISVTVKIETEQGGVILSAGTFVGGTIRIVSPSAGVVEPGTMVRFTLVIDEGYELDKVYLAEDPTYEIAKNPMSDNSYYFLMPEHNATIMASFNGGDIPPAPVTLTSISVSGQKTVFELNETFVFDGTVTAKYTDGTTKTVVPTSVSTPDMTTAGSKTVLVSYTEDGVTKATSYSITVNEGTTPVEPGEFGGEYHIVIPMSNPEYYHEYVLNFIDGSTGTYTRYRYNAEGYSTVAIANFTYTKAANGSLNIKLTGFSMGDNTSFMSGYRLFVGNDGEQTNPTGVWSEENDSITIKLVYANEDTQTVTFTR